MEDILSKYTIKKNIQTNKNIQIKIKNKKYIYNIQKNLLENIPNTKFLKIFVCIYKVKKFSKNLIMPSLEYLLYKENNEMILPFFNITSKHKNIKTLIENFSLFLLKKIKNNNSVEIKGYLTVDKNLFCFLQVKNNLIKNIKLNNIQNDEKLWWTTLYEINSGNLINYKIHESVKYIFNENKFLYSFNKKNIYREKILYICESCDDTLNIIKNHFVKNRNFQPLKNCIKNAKKKKIKKPVLIRCSIFFKKNKSVNKGMIISNLFRILPVSIHFIKFTSNNKFKIK